MNLRQTLKRVLFLCALCAASIGGMGIATIAVADADQTAEFNLHAEIDGSFLGVVGTVTVSPSITAAGDYSVTFEIDPQAYIDFSAAANQPTYNVLNCSYANVDTAPTLSNDIAVGDLTIFASFDLGNEVDMTISTPTDLQRDQRASGRRHTALPRHRL